MLIKHLLSPEKTQQARLTPPAPSAYGGRAGRAVRRSSAWPSPPSPADGGRPCAQKPNAPPARRHHSSQPGPFRLNRNWTHLVSKATQRGGSPAFPAPTSFPRWEEIAPSNGSAPPGAVKFRNPFPRYQFLLGARGSLRSVRSVQSSALTVLKTQRDRRSTPSHGSQENPSHLLCLVKTNLCCAKNQHSARL